MTRVLGTLPISVGTALAMEALQKAPMHQYKTLLINLTTIVRNAREAYPELPSSSELHEAVKSDLMEIANFIVSLKLKSVLELKVYYPSYQSLPNIFPMAKLRCKAEKKTARQLAIEKLDGETLKSISKEFDKVIEKTDTKLVSFIGETLIVTHHPVDLVMTDGYTRLNLLESHTGEIKRYQQFYTKLTGGSELTNIPLNKLTIQIFGDRSVDFFSHSLGVKNEIKELALSAKWSSASTVSYVTRTIKSLNNSPERDILLKMI